MSAMCCTPCPGSTRVCERDEGHDGEHQSTLSPRRTYVYWYGDASPVKYRIGVVAASVPLVTPQEKP